MKGRKPLPNASYVVLLGLSLIILPSCSYLKQLSGESNRNSPQKSPQQVRSNRVQGLLNDAYNYKKLHPGEEVGFLARIDRVLAEAPSDARALREKGYTQIRQKKYTQSSQTFAKLASLYHEPTVYLQLGYLYDVMNRPNDAISAFKNAYHYGRSDAERQQARRAIAVIRSNMRYGKRRHAPLSPSASSYRPKS